MNMLRASSKNETSHHPLLLRVLFRNNLSWRRAIIIVLFLVVISVILTVTGIKQDHIREQQEFLQHIIAFGHAPLLSIEIVYGDQATGRTEHLMLSPQEISAVQSLLQQGDLARVGGHNFVKSSYTLTFVGHLGERAQFRGIVYGQYEWNKNDLYLTHLSPSDGTWRLAIQPIHIPQLGQWIRERMYERKDGEKDEAKDKMPQKQKTKISYVVTQ
jgi:hypothetical protein